MNLPGLYSFVLAFCGSAFAGLHVSDIYVHVRVDSHLLRKELKLNTAWSTLAHTPSTLSVGAQSSENFPESSKSEFPVPLTFCRHTSLACLSPYGFSVTAG